MIIILRNASIFDQDCEMIEHRACSVAIHITATIMTTVCAETSESQVEISVIRAAAASLGYNALKTEQKQALEAFSRHKDVFVSLPTGYGRSQVAGNNYIIITYRRVNFSLDCETFINDPLHSDVDNY